MKLEGKTNEELTAMARAIENDPANRNPVAGSIFKYTKAAHRKLDAIALQITHNLAAGRAAAGDPVVCSGYSGRQSNRRS